MNLILSDTICSSFSIYVVPLGIYLGFILPFSILDKYEKEEYIGEKKKRIDRFKYWTPNDY